MSDWLDRQGQRQGLTVAVARARRAVWITYLLLLGLLCVSGLWHYWQGHAEALALIVRALPLALFLPTLLTQRRRGHIWLTAIGLLYALQGVLLFSEGAGSLFVVLEILASAALSVTAFCYVRWRGQLDRQTS